MFDADMLLVGAKIDLGTGEVIPSGYKVHKRDRQVIRTKVEPSDVEPSWIRIPPPDHMQPEQANDTAKAAAPVPRKKRVNSLQMYLADHLSFSDALGDLPMLDNIVVGGSLLDMGGNTRPASLNGLFHLLKNLDVITPAGVRAIRGCSVRHSEKLAQCLRVIVAAFDAVVNGSYPQPNA
jgi:hypothetical protein